MIIFCEFISSKTLRSLISNCVQLLQRGNGNSKVAADSECVFMTYVERVVFNSLFDIFIISFKDFTSL